MQRTSAFLNALDISIFSSNIKEKQIGLRWISHFVNANSFVATEQEELFLTICAALFLW